VVVVQDVSEYRTLVTQELDALPTAQSFATLGTTLPSVAADQNDVGGSQGEKGNVLAAHGGNGFDVTLNVDGIAISNMGTTTNHGSSTNLLVKNPPFQGLLWRSDVIWRLRYGARRLCG